MSRLLISDEVHALLSTTVLERILAMREHTTIICNTCGVTITPEDPDIVSVSLDTDPPADRGALRFAHATCAPSTVTYTTLPDGLRDDFTYYWLLRRGRIGAVLMWEPVSLALNVDAGQAANVIVYTRQGFAPSQDGIADTNGPVLPGWTLRNEGDDLVLHAPNGPAETFHLAADATDPERALWLKTAKTSRRCLLIVGESLGLERFDADRIGALLADGRAVAAVVLAKITAGA